MAELLIIRFGFFNINTKSIIEFNNMPIVHTTTPKASGPTPGIYTSPPNDFTTTVWFETNFMYLDKPSKTKLQALLTKYAITKVTII
jgi:hypothetical protein